MVPLLSELDPGQVRRCLHGRGLGLRLGPFGIRLRSTLPEVAHWLPFLYAAYSAPQDLAFADFHVQLDRPAGLRRWYRPQVRFRLDATLPFKPLPRGQALPFFEWGLNWSVARHAHQYLILHAGVLERRGKALLLPGPPGAGKSTLCAALMTRGWRLLSDELALIQPESGAVQPLPRPVSLKDRGIDVIRHLDPEAPFGPSCRDTAKGTVAHVRPPQDAVRRIDEVAAPGWVVRPEFGAGTGASLQPLAPEEGLRLLVANAFNYSTVGSVAFHRLADWAGAAPAYSLPYDDLETACVRLTALADGRGG